MYKFDKNNHSIYSLNYHLIQCIKYRKKVLVDTALIDDLKSKTYTLAEKYGIIIVAIETDKDHVHILFNANPQTELLKFINNWKSSTSKYIQNQHKDKISHLLWNHKFWSNSYCLITTGQVLLDQVKKYVEQQGQK